MADQATEGLQRKGPDPSISRMPKRELIETYRELTGRRLPAMARERGDHWPVRHDHCFQRIVLDNVCQGVWYDHIAKPAYQHLEVEQARKAVELCLDIISGRRDLRALNQQSLRWRGKA